MPANPPTGHWLWFLAAIPAVSAAGADLSARRGWRWPLVACTVGYSVLTWIAALAVSYLLGGQEYLGPFVLAMLVAVLAWVILRYRFRRKSGA
jgi:drug/metabolite transporter (DMT)-like permease